MATKDLSTAIRTFMLFHYSIKNRHVLAELLKAYGVKTLQVVKAATTRWLSHGAACKRCREI